MAYGCLIVTFLGAVHWGMALTSTQGESVLLEVTAVGSEQWPVASASQERNIQPLPDYRLQCRQHPCLGWVWEAGTVHATSSDVSCYHIID